MHPVDLCSALVVTTGNRALRAPGQAPWDELEELLSIRLRPVRLFDSQVLFTHESGERRAFHDWLAAHASPTARLWLAPLPPPAPLSPEDDDDVPDPHREALAADLLGGVLFTDGPQVELFVPREVRPHLYDVTGAQLLAFIRGRKSGRALEALLEQELASELAGTSLADFLQPRGVERMQDIVSRFMPLGARLEFSAARGAPDPAEVLAWNRFFSPVPSALRASFEYLPLGPVDPASAEHDVAAARAGLTAVLEEALAFAERHAQPSWRKYFRRCLQCLTLEPPPLSDLIELMLLNALPTPAVQLALAAQTADLSSVAGPWNELPLDKPGAAEHRALTQRLRASVRSALRASINGGAA